MIELMPIARQFRLLKDEILREISDTIEQGSYILGPKVAKLENRISAMIGAGHAVAVANGTDALVLALDALGIGTGDEVITTPYSFFATAEAVSRLGAVPVFVDIDPFWSLDPERVEAAITPRTKAILPVHLFGQPADMDGLRSIADRRGLPVVEDACQAFGAKYGGQSVGTLGIAGCFSFFPSKNLGTMGDGGIVVTPDAELAKRLRKLRQHGSSKRYYHDAIGYNSRLDELHAAILLVMADHVEESVKRRRAIAQTYDERLRSLGSLLEVPGTEERRFHAYNLYCITSPRREEIREALTAENIQTGIYYPRPLHLQRAYASLGYAAGDFPVAEKLSAEILALPMGPLLTEQEQERVVTILQNIAEKG
ncbi:DegT/DnrJ/EryC1/StrS family aminotransferase [Cohnella cellulosilytica]|uniref:DegT/DnrJ/EryC1/StrS family aminotransferase n=1 Tax=Cohnella cellulosilytica TaxID=986710 RepID=A0ABW2FBV8_9BACL